MKKEFYQGNRARVYAQMKEHSLLILFSGREVRKTNDEFYPFYTNRNFLYLTGLDQKELVLLARKDGQGNVTEKVFLLPPDSMAERWNGVRIKPQEATDLSGVQNIGYTADFEAELHRLATSGNYASLYLDLFRVSPTDRDEPAHLLLNRVATDYPYLKIENANVLIRRLRTIKQPCELEAMRKAEEITCAGITSMMKASKPGMFEYQYKAVFDYALGQYGIETGLNEDVINKVNDYFKPIKQKYVDSGRISAKSMATDAQALVYKVPGGMLSNMIANLTDMKAMDKFDAALKEIPEVRKDLGYPPLVTPLSQMVGNQAVTNVLMGERYKIVSKEVQNYFRGQYGIAPAPVSESLQAKILGEGGKPVDCRIEDAKRTGEDFKKAKEALGDLARSEEDVMSYICYPDQAMKFFEDRKAKEENICTYVIEEA